MRNMSFFLTQQQLLSRTKDVTRRLGWVGATKGDRIRAVEKGQGLKPGEKIKPLAVIEVVSVRREPLKAITAEDVRREGFPCMTPKQFVEMFCKHMGLRGPDGPKTEVTRIEFKVVEDLRRLPVQQVEMRLTYPEVRVCPPTRELCHDCQSPEVTAYVTTEAKLRPFCEWCSTRRLGQAGLLRRPEWEI